MFDKSAFFGSKRKSIEVSLPDIGTATVRSIGIPQKVELEIQSKAGGPTYTALLICACTYGEDGNPIFIMEDAALIDLLDFHMLSELAFAVHKINGTGANASEDAKKNS